MANEKMFAFIICVNDKDKLNKCTQYIGKLKIPNGYEMEIVEIKAARCIAKGYNKGRKQSKAKYKIYIHQDTYILDEYMLHKILRVFEYDQTIGMIGSVGAKRLGSDFIWWNAKDKYGKVYENRKTIQMLDFDKQEYIYKEVEAIDGFIMITQYDIPWREDILNGWHFYDISQSIEYQKAGYKVVVPYQKDPWVLHDCGEEIDLTGYDEKRREIMDEYEDYLINRYKHSREIDEAINTLVERLKGNLKQTDVYLKVAELCLTKEQYNLAYLFLENALNYAKQHERKNIYKLLENTRDNYNIQVKSYSIIILTYNNLEYTKKCIESIRSNNILDNHEIIIVDNGSTDGSREWIASLEGIKYILNEKNVGFPKGCNQGIKLANKENDIFLLNNDTIIMPNSIFNLRLALYSGEQVGAAGAVSNIVSYGQQIEEKYESLKEYYTYAMNNNVPRINDQEMRLKLVGFAMLIKREVLNKVGYLDEQFTPGNYEDDDLSIRIIEAGYRNILCKNSFIFHYGSVSFKKEQNRYMKLLNVNKEKFKTKWGFDANYSLIIRNDIIECVNDECDQPIRVLEIGCACGATLLAIKSKYKNAEIYGIEINENAGKIAQYVANVTNGNIEKEELAFQKEMFDYIIFADILEHLHHPENVLDKVKKYLKKEGKVIASIPNVKHISVVADLLRGRWTYRDAGILDDTHLRFFTLLEIGDLFERTGYTIDHIKATSMALDDEYKNMIKNLEMIAPERNNEYLHYQYIISAKKVDISERLNLKRICKLLDYIEVNNEDIQSMERLLKELDEEKGLELLVKGIYTTVIDKVKIFNLLALECYNNKRYEEIIPLLKEALKLKRDDFDTIYNMATILAMLGEIELANYYIDQLNESNDVKEQIRKEIVT